MLAATISVNVSGHSQALKLLQLYSVSKSTATAGRSGGSNMPAVHLALPGNAKVDAAITAIMNILLDAQGNSHIGIVAKEGTAFVKTGATTPSPWMFTESSICCQARVTIASPSEAPQNTPQIPDPPIMQTQIGARSTTSTRVAAMTPSPSRPRGRSTTLTADRAMTPLNLQVSTSAGSSEMKAMTRFGSQQSAGPPNLGRGWK